MTRMTSRQLKELRRRQARDAAAAVDRRIGLHDRRAAEADAAGLLNEAIYHKSKANYWRARRDLVADPHYHAMVSAARRAARSTNPSPNR